MGAWTERHTDGAGSLTIDVEALDAEQTERDEIVSFKRALTAPKNDPNAFTDKYGVRRSSLDAVRMLVGVASAFGLFACFVWTISASPPLYVLVVGLLAGM